MASASSVSLCRLSAFKITLCTLIIAGEVIFDRNHPAHPPDIIFSGDDEELDFAPNIEQLEVRCQAPLGDTRYVCCSPPCAVTR